MCSLAETKQSNRASNIGFNDTFRNVERLKVFKLTPSLPMKKF